MGKFWRSQMLGTYTSKFDNEHTVYTYVCVRACVCAWLSHLFIIYQVLLKLNLETFVETKFSGFSVIDSRNKVNAHVIVQSRKKIYVCLMQKNWIVFINTQQSSFRTFRMYLTVQMFLCPSPSHISHRLSPPSSLPSLNILMLSL